MYCVRIQSETANGNNGPYSEPAYTTVTNDGRYSYRSVTG